jgi:prepilin signal peptidase PulO-like enzyme (type II secretory pathway)
MTVLLVTAAGLLVAWLITVPLFRYKEFRPKSRRDVSSEGDLVIRAVIGHARYPGTTIDVTAADVVPVWSWFVPNRHAGRRVPPLVVALHLGLPLAMALTARTFDSGPATLVLAYCWFCVLAVAVAVIDARIWLIPWWMPWIGSAVGAVLLTAAAVDLGRLDRVVWAAASGAGSIAVFFVLFLAAPGRLGFGDVRLALPIGMFAGFVSPLLVLWAFLLGSLLGVLLGVVSIASKRGRHFAFGPPLTAGALVAVWLSSQLL